MTSIKVKFRAAAETGREGTIYYQIIHNRCARQLVTVYKVLPEDWDERRSVLKIPEYGVRQRMIRHVREMLRRDVDRLWRIVRRLDDEGTEYTADDVMDEYNRYVHDYSLHNFMSRIIGKLRINGKIRTAETYRVTMSSFRKFLECREGEGHSGMNGMGWSELMIDDLDGEMMEEYEGWQRARGVTPNTISFYLRILRAVYNRAVENGAVENCHPFRHVYTGIDKTVKRALPINTIKRIRQLDLHNAPSLDYARDMFMLSFFLRGMSFVDMAFLRKSDLKNGHVIYRRRKTGQQLMIGWTKEMQNILDKYPENSTDYLLPIIRSRSGNERCTYRNVGYNINRSLKKIAELVGVDMPLTLYVARHSWASAARTKGIPLSVISEGMGHDSEATTQIYLASLDTSVVDRANSLIMASV